MTRAAIGTLERKASGQFEPTEAEHFDPVDIERRIEDWVVCHLDDLDPQTTCMDVVLQNMDFDFLAEGALRKTKPTQDTLRKASRGEDWTRFRVERRKGVSVVTLLDTLLIKEESLRDFDRELGELIDAGYHRLILDFSRVERFSSQVVATVTEARRKCQSIDGGALKVCIPKPELAQALVLLGAFQQTDIHPDARSARAAPWPIAIGPRPLPVSILSALTNHRVLDKNNAHVKMHLHEKCVAPIEQAPPDFGELDAEFAVWLVAEVGKRRGHSIPVRGAKFLIGRDPGCAIRTESPTVSRVHASILRRADHVYIRDLASTNGTLVNGWLVKDRFVPLINGDRIQIGPLVFRVAIGYDRLPTGSLEEMVASWLDNPIDEHLPAETIESAVEDSAEDADLSHHSKLHAEVSEGVLIVTPRAGELDDESSLNALRSGLFEMFERSLPKRVVINLEHVSRISSRAIGVLLAHHLRLDREGGALRLAEVHSQVRSTIERVRLPMLLEAFAIVEEAVLAAWPS